MKTLSKLLPTSIAIIAVAVLAWYALSQGINGATLSLAFTIIGGLAGYKLAKP